MKESKDLRFKILEYLQKNGSSTEEVQCNKFLFTLHSDLATIKRTLKELVEIGYINESNIDWITEKDKSVLFNLDTTGATGEENNRIERLNDPNDIKEIRLYLTLIGKKFLIESANLSRTTRLLKYDLLIKLLFVAIGIIATLFTQYISKRFLDFDTKENTECCKNND